MAAFFADSHVLAVLAFTVPRGAFAVQGIVL